MNRVAAVVAVACLSLVLPYPAVAQAAPDRFELGAQVLSARSGQFDQTDIGLGARLSWHPTALLGIESELDVYPGEFPDGPPFSRGRIEGLFGVTAGPRFDRVRPFARLRSGFLTMREASRPFACIAIYPPLLSCDLASGRTLAVFDIGGGIEVFAGPRAFVRVDAGDRLVKYQGPVIDNNRVRQDDSFVGHDFRLALGAGLRF